MEATFNVRGFVTSYQGFGHVLVSLTEGENSKSTVSVISLDASLIHVNTNDGVGRKWRVRELTCQHPCKTCLRRPSLSGETRKGGRMKDFGKIRDKVAALVKKRERERLSPRVSSSPREKKKESLEGKLRGGISLLNNRLLQIPRT